MIYQAVILAGGKGERLRPLTQDRPKCMVDVFGKPFLEYQLGWIQAYGIKQVFVSCGYMNEVIQDYFGNGSRWGLEIDYIIENEPLGRGGGLKLALQKTNVDFPVIAMNGDVFTAIDIHDLDYFHAQHKPLATMVAVPLKSPYGIIEVDKNDTITGFKEKPELPHWINAGVYVLDPFLKELLPDKGDHETTLFPDLAKKGKLKAYCTWTYWRGMDTVKDLSELKKELDQMSMATMK